MALDTWGEFRAALPPGYDEDISEMLEDEDVPTDDAKFDPDVIPGYSDGDWPAWLQQVMLEWMPAELIQRYGSVDESMWNGKMLTIESAVGEELARELEALGFTCEHDDRAIASAAGWA